MAKSHKLILQTKFILDFWLSSKYTLSIELLLDRFGQSNKLRKESKKEFRDIQQKIPHCP